MKKKLKKSSQLSVKTIYECEESREGEPLLKYFGSTSAFWQACLLEARFTKQTKSDLEWNVGEVLLDDACVPLPAVCLDVSIVFRVCNISI